MFKKMTKSGMMAKSKVTCLVVFEQDVETGAQTFVNR